MAFMTKLLDGRLSPKWHMPGTSHESESYMCDCGKKIAETFNSMMRNQNVVRDELIFSGPRDFPIRLSEESKAQTYLASEQSKLPVYSPIKLNMLS